MEPGVVIVGIILRILSFLSMPLFYLQALLRPHKQLPSIQDSLLLTSATKLAALIRNKEVKSQHVVDVFIRRIKLVNPTINAIVEDRFEDAMEEAKEVDKYLEKCNQEQLLQFEKTKPLFGVPVTIKESCSLKGMSIAVGALNRLGMKATEDGLAVARLRASGAIPLLVSTTPELCLSWQTSNLVTGRTKNPYNNNRTPGGSSGGEGALIGAGASVIGISSDIAGSIRVPAMFCGIFGHKPTPGLIPLDGHHPGSSKDERFLQCLTIGPLTRYSEDLETMMQVMAAESYQKINPKEVIDLNKIKVLYMYQATDHIAMQPTHEAVRDAIAKGVEYLKEKYRIETELASFDFDEAVEMTTSILFDIEDVANLLYDKESGRDKNLYIEVLKAFFGQSRYSLEGLSFYLLRNHNCFVNVEKRKHFQRKAAKMRELMIETLGENGIFIFPTSPESAYYHNQIFTKTSGVLYSMLFNVFGMPATHVPMGFDKNGLPVGFQVAASPHRDRLCIAVAKELEKAFGGWKPPA